MSLVSFMSNRGQHQDKTRQRPHVKIHLMYTLNDPYNSATDTLGFNTADTISKQRLTAMGSFAKYVPCQRKLASRNGTCTHLTMTRLYTKDFRCVMCLRTSSMGWLWRCTQDRDLMLEEDAAFNEVRQLPAYCFFMLTSTRASWMRSAI
jgi:hypothetical protein